jgi:hypothetical protein
MKETFGSRIFLYLKKNQVFVYRKAFKLYLKKKEFDQWHLIDIFLP